MRQRLLEVVQRHPTQSLAKYFEVVALEFGFDGLGPSCEAICVKAPRGLPIKITVCWLFELFVD